MFEIFGEVNRIAAVVSCKNSD